MADRPLRPQMAEDVRWKCQCGKTGWLKNPPDKSLAGLVRHARRVHRCADPDIVSLASREEVERLEVRSVVVASSGSALVFPEPPNAERPTYTQLFRRSNEISDRLFGK